MKLLNRAKITNGDAWIAMDLVQEAPKVIHWIVSGISKENIRGKAFGLHRKVGYLDASNAIAGLRVAIDQEPEWVGWDLTVYPLSPPPEERAARAILNAVPQHVGIHEDEISGIIRDETAIDKLVESANALAAYEIPRLRYPKPPGLDVVHANLLLQVMEALERAQAIDLSNMKKSISLEGPIQVVQTVPQRGKVV